MRLGADSCPASYIGPKCPTAIEGVPAGVQPRAMPMEFPHGYEGLR